jgi:hypothetical protein
MIRGVESFDPNIKMHHVEIQGNPDDSDGMEVFEWFGASPPCETE